MQGGGVKLVPAHRAASGPPQPQTIVLPQQAPVAVPSQPTTWTESKWPAPGPAAQTRVSATHALQQTVGFGKPAAPSIASSWMEAKWDADAHLELKRRQLTLQRQQVLPCRCGLRDVF